jgi:hypothetical protein
MPRNQADTLAGQIMAAEVVAYRRTGAWPRPAHIVALEDAIRAKHPEWPDEEITAKALVENHFNLTAGRRLP